ncbi:hypothetical protein [Altericroceibacterium xinjiangense]|uniref:hypothetical protein n=1 Tax=Altericroceibacterium xinjiangense TaxID=762261 RepID=UPI000F7F6A9B|nr:hypothetical protein [Altericroceibacterium xinjiangense]
MASRLIVTLIGLVSLCSASVLVAGSDLTSETVGPFVVESEHWTRDGPPDPHFPSQSKHVRLIWKSNDGKVEALLEGNGNIIKYEYTMRPSEKMTCFVNLGLLPMDAVPSDGEFWDVQSARFDEVSAEGCDELADAEVTKYQAEMRAALPSAPAAFDLWRMHSANFFASERRCLELERLNPPHFQFHRSCKTYSDQPH